MLQNWVVILAAIELVSLVAFALSIAAAAPEALPIVATAKQAAGRYSKFSGQTNANQNAVSVTARRG